MVETRDEGRPRKVCCMVSEVLEEAGLDRETARRLRRQMLEGIILLCQWQLERMQDGVPARNRARGRPRKVAVE